MIILGAGGHARELYELMSFDKQSIYFFDDFTKSGPDFLFDLPIVSNETAVKKLLASNRKVAIGTGNGRTRQILYEKFKVLGAEIISVVAHTAIVSNISCKIDGGVNIMHFSFISNNTSIGFGSLVNARVNIHHDVKIGVFCEIGPGAVLLGNVQVDDFSFIGAGAIILPGVQIGKHCVVGAGAVVTKNVSDYSKVKGNPAK
jgi:sugar O-acyltransferase (sialic acid O-acetyltransferase NeuD family)